MKFLHTMIRVKDIDASLKFLNDKEKTCQIELTFNDETPAEGYNIGSGFGHFAFAVESLENFTAKIKHLGYDYIYPPFDLNGKGTKIAFIQDPDGYEIELIEKVIW